MLVQVFNVYGIDKLYPLYGVPPKPHCKPED
jgi:hypothetical protein